MSKAANVKSERDKLPKEDFGDPERRLFPIVDQEDVDSAKRLIGKAKDPEAVKKRIVGIAKRKGLTIPDAWKAEMSISEKLQTVTTVFALDSQGRRVEDGFAVYPNSKLFEAGDYPDKNFAASPEELLAVCSDFKPFGGNIEHTDFLKGRACEVRRVFVDDEDPFTLRGEVAVPLWLDENLAGHEKRLSCEFEADKSLTGIALCITPRVADAALMSAFAEFAKRHDTPQGQRAVQEVHDLAARYGAVCQQSNAKMASRHESAGMQKIHDTAVEHGAVCASVGDGRMPTFPYFNEGKEHMSEKKNWLARAWEKLTDDEREEATAELGVTAESKRAQFNNDPALVAQVAKLAADNIRRDAEAFAREEVLAHRALPAEQAALVAEFTARAEDDAASPRKIKFVAGGKEQEGTRVEAFVAMCKARPAHKLTQEQVAASSLTALSDAQETPEAKQAREAREGAKAWAEFNKPRLQEVK